MKKKDSIQKLEIVLFICYFMLLLELAFASLSKATAGKIEIIESVYSGLYSLVAPIVVISTVSSIILLIKSIKKKRISGILIALPTFVIFSISLLLIMISV